MNDQPVLTGEKNTLFCPHRIRIYRTTKPHLNISFLGNEFESERDDTKCHIIKCDTHSGIVKAIALGQLLAQEISSCNIAKKTTITTSYKISCALIYKNFKTLWKTIKANILLFR